MYRDSLGFKQDASKQIKENEYGLEKAEGEQMSSSSGVHQKNSLSRFLPTSKLDLDGKYLTPLEARLIPNRETIQ